MRVLRTVAEVEALRGEWRVLQGATLATDIDFFLTIAAAHPEVVRPHVLVVERDGTPSTIVPAHLHDQRLVSSVVGIDVYRPKVRAVNVVYGGVLGEAGRESLRLAVAELRRTVDAREADVLLLRYLDTESLLYGVATEEAPAVLRQRFVRPATRWHMDLGESLEETLRSRSAKVRENARRIARRIAADFGSSAEVRVFREAGELEVLARDIDKVASVSYQRPGRALFGRDGLERALTRLGLERGWFRGYILYLGGEPAAFWTGFLYGGVFGWRGATGYDPRLARYSPGAHLMTRLIDHLCAEGARVFDLGRGDLQYKRWLASGFQHEVDVRIHAARPAEVAVGLASSAVNATHALVRTVGSLADRDGRLRRKLQRRSAPQRLAGP